MNIQRHLCRVAATAVGNETSIGPNILIAQSDNLQDTGCGTRCDLHSLSYCAADGNSILAPFNGRFGKTIECTGNGRRGTIQEVKVRGEHGELGRSCDKRREGGEEKRGRERGGGEKRDGKRGRERGEEKAGRGGWEKDIFFTHCDDEVRP